MRVNTIDNALMSEQELDHFLCVICKDTVEDAQKCKTCEHMYCLLCINESLKHDQRCPHCKQ